MKEQHNPPGELPTKSQFVMALREEYVERYAWSKDEAKLNHVMAGWSLSLRPPNLINVTNEGPAFQAACRKLRLDPRSTITFLRTLPD
jgi:hypothetical protein